MGVWLVVFLYGAMCLSDLKAAETETILLWSEGAPGALGTEEKDCPRLTVYLPQPEKSSGAAVVVLPGGGYGALAISYEGHEIAAWLNTLGVAGFVADYRHRGKGYGHPAPLEDVQRAVRLVRARAAEWKIDPAKIGVLGFSAGGHLASSSGVIFDAGNQSAADPIQRQSCRPDFLILCYPVIAFGEPYTHQGSQTNLLGADASDELVRSMSTEKQVTPETPPTFLWHTTEDTGVPPENSIQFYLALRRAGVPAELHVFERGRHGLGLAHDTPGADRWPELCHKWLIGRGLAK
jgi:acetyl esterase/lipase